MKTALYFLSAAIFHSAAWAGEAVSVSGLAKGDSMEIRFSSRGCFHSSTDLIEIVDGNVKFSNLVMKWDEVKKEEIEVSRKLAGTMKMEKGDAQKLDKLFQYYAGEPDGGCTTVDTISVRIFRDGKSVRSALYEDASCGTYELEGALTFPALKAKLVKGS